MKNSHKIKGYRLDTRLTKNSYLDLKKYVLPKKFEMDSETIKPFEIQKLQEKLEEEIQTKNLFQFEELPQLKKYLIQSHITEQPFVAALTKIETYLHRQQNEKKHRSSKDQELTKKNDSQITEVHSVHKDD